MIVRSKAWWTTAALAAVIAVAAVQATLWVFLVPIYQSPDEPAHLDYALALRAHGGLILARHTKFKELPVDAHPYTQHLRNRSGLNAIAFNPSSKVSPDYGTPEFFAALDRDAPDVSALTIDRPCQLASLYPFGYYALLAVWMEGISRVVGGVTALFFGARLLSVILLIGSLALSYATMRLMNDRPAFGLLVVACIGWFPLTSFVGSYVQPDNLSFFLTSLSFFAAMRMKRFGPSVANSVGLGIALGLLLITKIHFWLCVAPATLALAMTLPPRSTSMRLGRLSLLLVPSLVLGGLWQWTVWGTENYFAPPEQTAGPLIQALRMTRRAIEDFFMGPSHISFWGVFGWLDTPLKIRNDRVTEIVSFLVQATTLVLLGLTLIRIERIASRLVRLIAAGRPMTATRIALSNPVVNSYFLFVVFMVFLFAWTSNRFGAQGRNWLPMMLPILLVNLDFAPKALSSKAARYALAGFVAVGFLFYGTVGNLYARKSVHDRYYFRMGDRPVVEMVDLASPTHVHEMTWTSGRGVATGGDPHVVLALPSPRYVYAIQCRFTTSETRDAKTNFQLFWKPPGREFSEHDRSVRYSVPAGAEKQLTIWVNGEISHLRFDPDHGPCDFQLHEAKVLRESDESRQQRESRRRAR